MGDSIEVAALRRADKPPLRWSGSRGVAANTLLGVAGVLLGVGALEGALQIASGLYQSHTRLEPSASVRTSGGERATILCVGDSHTWGHGARTRETAYPGRLQALFDAGPFQGVRVMNGGISGQNSSQVANALPQQFVQDNPSIVLILIGTNNWWNVEDLGGSTWWLQGFNHLKVVKLGALLAYNLQAAWANVRGQAAAERAGEPQRRRSNGPSAAQTQMPASRDPFDRDLQQGWQALLRDELAQAMEHFEAARRLAPERAAVYFALGHMFLRRGDPGLAVEALQECRRLDPQFRGLYRALGRAYGGIGDMERATQMLIQAVAQNPKDARSYRLLGRIYCRQPGDDPARRPMAIQQLERAFALDHNFLQTYGVLTLCFPDKQALFDEVERLVRRTGYELSAEDRGPFERDRRRYEQHAAQSQAALVVENEVLRKDLIRIVQTVRAHGAVPILLTYSLVSVMNPVIRGVARALRTELYDLERVFTELQASEGGNYFLADGGHPNELGYQRMAEAIYQRLTQDAARWGPAAAMEAPGPTHAQTH